jgi:alanine racemase
MQGIEDRWRLPEGQEAGYIGKGKWPRDQAAFDRGKIRQGHHDDGCNPRMNEFQPVLEWKTRIVFLKEVPEGTGLSYGHAFYTARSSLIATIPVGYGDGLDRRLSNSLQVLVGGTRCPQVGLITMDQSLVDVTALRDQVGLGDEVVLIGAQGQGRVTADEMAGRLRTINYEIVTAIAGRVPRSPFPQHESSQLVTNTAKCPEC